jgi:hypothetical protein
VRGKVGVIGTFYGRHEASLPLLRRLYQESSRRPDECWLMCESDEDRSYLERAANELGRWQPGLRIVVEPTPRRDGKYLVIPYSNKINWALEHIGTDYVVYLDNGSMPHPDKYRVMADALDAHPEWGAVYCAQRRTGLHDTVSEANEVVGDGFCAVNYTQVMHRRTPDRWLTDMQYANPDLADGHFWRALHVTLGEFHPVGPSLILDEHHIPSAHAEGVA